MLQRMLLLGVAAMATGQSAPKRNVLFIAVDDMRPSIGAFNFSLAHTPHMDQLASTGLVFKRAYVQYAFCAPSRNSFMSGRRPDTTRVWNFADHFRQPLTAAGQGAGGEDWLSMPQYFKHNGYLTLGSGKLYHPGVPPDNDCPTSWTQGEPADVFDYFCPECTPFNHAKVNQSKCPSSSARGPPNGIFHCVSEDPEEGYSNKSGGYTLCAANTTKEEMRPEYQLEDQKIRDAAIRHLKTAKALFAKKGATTTAGEEEAEEEGGNNGKGPTFENFFIGAGFHKPHVPWVFPQEFLDFYPSDLNDIPLADDTYAPQGMPPYAWHFPADVHGMPPFDGGTANSTANYTRSRNFRRGYYAAISYTDYNIGVLLQTLEDLGFADNTAVIVFGDHGWQLGEHDTWAKMTNFEVALRTPLIIRAPWMKNSVGKVTSVLAEAVDFYPTLAALAGLPDPVTAANQGLNGTSLLPVFADPDDTSIKSAAYSQFAKPYVAKPYLFWPTPARTATEVMGYTVRTDNWRYTCWFAFNGKSVTVITDKILGTELYDHTDDPGELDWKGEHINVVNSTVNAAIVAELHTLVLDYIQLKPISLDAAAGVDAADDKAGAFAVVDEIAAELYDTLH